MGVLMEHCLAIKFRMHLNKNTVEIILLLQEALGNEVLEVSMIKRWHKIFLDGGEYQDDHHWRGPSWGVHSH